MPRRRSPFAIALLTIVVAALAALGGLWLARSLGQTPTLASGTWLDAPRTIAPFELHDDHDLPFGNDRLNGAPSLLFFGFTHCPDVCPTTLATLAEVLRARPVARLRVIFVTIDPERDTVPELHRYVSAFGSEFLGLTGSQQSLAPLTRSLSVAFERIALPGGDYTLDHSAALYVIDSHGRFVAVFTPPFSSQRIAADLASVGGRLGS
jgi:protein SCO1/2